MHTDSHEWAFADDAPAPSATWQCSSSVRGVTYQVAGKFYWKPGFLTRHCCPLSSRPVQAMYMWRFPTEGQPAGWCPCGNTTLPGIRWCGVSHFSAWAKRAAKISPVPHANQVQSMAIGEEGYRLLLCYQHRSTQGGTSSTVCLILHPFQSQEECSKEYVVPLDMLSGQHCCLQVDTAADRMVQQDRHIIIPSGQNYGSWVSVTMLFHRPKN